MRARVYLQSSEQMTAVDDSSVKLLIGGSVYLGKGVDWKMYEKLYTKVYVDSGLRVIAHDGLFVVIQTNAYFDGTFLCRYALLFDFLISAGWELIDERVWERRKADHFQVPFSHVLIFRPPGGIVTRRTLVPANGKSTTPNNWFQGVWRYPQTAGGNTAGFPSAMCRMIVESCTQPGDLVVDPFAGTGQILVEASRLGRRAVGYEIDETRVEILEKNGCQVIQK